MSEAINVSSGLFEETLKDVSTKIIWKDQLKHSYYEDDKYYINIDKYMSAYHKLTRVFTVSYIKELLGQNEAQLRLSVASIDPKYHPLIKTMRDYEEKNDYFRELYGLPPSTVTYISTVTEEMSVATGIPQTKEITVMTSEEYNDMELRHISNDYYRYIVSEGIYAEYLYESDLLDAHPDANIGTGVGEYYFAPSEVLTPTEKPNVCHHTTGDDNYCVLFDSDPGSDGHLKWTETTETVPNYIHELSYEDILSLISKGFIQSEIEKHPENVYLNHLTIETKIYPFLARDAKRFDLLYVPDTDPAILKTDYISTYNRCKDYAIRVFYTESFRPMGSIYEGFIGMLINFMTMQQMYTNYLDADITRDFYDVDSIRLVYDAYGVPFFEAIPVRYHQNIVKKINRLISYKGTNQVIIDLCGLFEYEILGIYRYYLLKERKIIEGKPATISQAQWNTMTDKQKLDALYEIKFVKSTNTTYTYASMTDNKNIESYSSVTYDDPYWINDGDLYSEIYRNQFNFIETKYLGIQLSFNITEMMFESIYFLRIFFDNKDVFDLSYITFSLTNSSITLFDAIIYLYAAICERNYGDSEYTGFIPYGPTQIAKIYGFNFKDNLQTLINMVSVLSEDNANIINNIPAAKRTAIVTQLEKCDVQSYKSVSSTYGAIRELYNILGDDMGEAKTIEEYQAYKELYETFLTTENIQNVVTLSDGTVASTYKDILKDSNYQLYLRLINPLTDLNNDIRYMIASLSQYCTDLKYIEYVAYDVGVITDFLYNLIAFFKSAKAQLLDFNVLFVMDSRIENLLKMIDQIHLRTATTELRDMYYYMIGDISSCTSSSVVKSKAPMSDRIFKI